MTARRLAAWVGAALALLAAVAAQAETIRFGPGSAAPTAFDAATGRYEEAASFDPYICA